MSTFKKQNQARSSFGLALGGGLVRGFAHVGVLQALEDHGLFPKYLAGTSAGALAAALYAFRIPLEDMRRRSHHLSWFTLSRLTLSRLGLATNEAVKTLVEDFIGKRTIEEATIPLAIVATDVSTGERVVLQAGDVATAVQASTCLPGLFHPVAHQGRLLIDGGFIDNVPIDATRELGAPFVVGVNINPVHPYERPRHVFDVIVNVYDMVATLATEDRLGRADFIITPDVHALGRADFRQAAAMYEAGYTAGEEAAPALRAALALRKSAWPASMVPQFFRPSP